MSARAMVLSFALAAGFLAGASARADYLFPGDIRVGHFPLGPNYGSWITDADDVLVSTGLAYAFKDIVLEGGESVVLHLGFDDGCYALWNGVEVLDARFEAHGVGHWNRSIDLTALGATRAGRNRLTLQAYNNCNGGAGNGGLNLELVVDGDAVWPDAAANALDPANEMWYTGADCGMAPPDDAFDRDWTDADYGWMNETASTIDRPLAFALESVHPNPFNPTTTIVFNQSETGAVRLSVVDAIGRQVALLLDGPSAAGRHEAVFDGSALASGIYFARLESEAGVAMGKMLLVK